MTEQNALEQGFISLHKIIEKLSERTKSSMRKGLKNSKLIDKYKNRDYLLDINPLDLCVEFQQHQQGTFNVVCQVLLGLNNIGSVFESQYLLNSVCTIYRKAFNKIKCSRL